MGSAGGQGQLRHEWGGGLSAGVGGCILTRRACLDSNEMASGKTGDERCRRRDWHELARPISQSISEPPIASNLSQPLTPAQGWRGVDTNSQPPPLGFSRDAHRSDRVLPRYARRHLRQRGQVRRRGQGQGGTTNRSRTMLRRLPGKHQYFDHLTRTRLWYTAPADRNRWREGYAFVA